MDLDTERTITEQCSREKLPLPERIANAPQLQEGLDLYLTAFYDLTTCRDYGFSEGPIPWVAILRYAEVQGITGDQREDLFYHVRELDRVYLNFQSRKAKAKTDGV